MKLLNFQRFLPRKYPVKTQNLTRKLSKYKADFSESCA
ncbi:positive regulator AgmR [Vibrio mimicus]|nr:positive regulator AgmR [Vibrio mimicus]